MHRARAAAHTRAPACGSPRRPRKTTARRLAFYGTFAGGAALDVVALARAPRRRVRHLAAAARRARGGGRGPRRAARRSCSTCATSGPPRPRRSASCPTRALVRCFERAERWLYRHARRRHLHDAPVLRATSTAWPAGPSRVHLPNGALDELLELPVERAAGRPVHARLRRQPRDRPGPAASCSTPRERCAASRCGFVLVGDGPLARGAARARRRARLDRGRVEPQVPVARGRRAARACHALLVPLARTTRCSADFIPSKLYDAMAVGRPVVVAAAGEAAALVRELGAGVAVAPEDADGAGGRRRARSPPTPSARAASALAGRAAARERARCRQVERLEAILREAARAVLGRLMCGIVGVWHRDGRAVDAALLGASATRCATAAPTTRACGRAGGRRRDRPKTCPASTADPLATPSSHC